MSNAIDKEELLAILKEVFETSRVTLVSRRYIFSKGELNDALDRLSQTENQIVALIEASKEVTEEFIKTYTEMIDTDPHHCTRENLIGMLSELGFKIEVK